MKKEISIRQLADVPGTPRKNYVPLKGIAWLLALTVGFAACKKAAFKEESVDEPAAKPSNQRAAVAAATIADMDPIKVMSFNVRNDDAGDPFSQDTRKDYCLQIILENDRNRRATLPTAFLHQLIKHGEAWQDFVQRSLKSSLDGIMTSQRESDRVLREWASRAGWLHGTPAEPKPEKRTEAAEGDALRDEVFALREQLRALEERLEKRRER